MHFVLTARQIDDLGNMQDRERAEARTRAIRAVVAAQWGVACALEAYNHEAMDGLSPFLDGWGCSVTAAAALPTAEQIVDGAA